MVYATAGLVDALLEMASDRAPASVSIQLGVTRGEAFPEAALPPEASVFTHFYLPDAGESVRAVFGVDLGTPPGRTPGVFVTHPDGVMSVRRTDPLREVVVIAVPPWDRDATRAFDRRGVPVELSLLDVEPPEESVP